jgi:hypothetical protein
MTIHESRTLITGATGQIDQAVFGRFAGNSYRGGNRIVVARAFEL